MVCFVFNNNNKIVCLFDKMDALFHTSIYRVENKTPPSSSINTGASILTYCIDPQWGDIFFLLGKEKYNRHWQSGSEKWGDFGGSRSQNEVDAEMTAAREFVEETCAVVKYFNNDSLPRISYDDIADSLRRGYYTSKFYVSYHSVKQEYFVVFVKEIPWDPECIQRFNTVRQLVKSANIFYNTNHWKRACMQYHPAISIKPNKVKNPIVTNKDYLEKIQLSYWSLQQLKYASEHNGMLRDGEYCRKSFYDFLHVLLSEFINL